MTEWVVALAVAALAMLGLVLSADSLVNADPDEGDAGAAIVGIALAAVGLGLSGLVAVGGLFGAARRTARLEPTVGGPLPGGEERAAARFDARLLEVRLRGMKQQTEELLKGSDAAASHALDSLEVQRLAEQAREAYVRLVALGESEQAERLLEATDQLEAMRVRRR